jgi:predicted transport protein
MSEINLFRLVDGSATKLHGHQSDLERPLQKLIERNLETMLGIRFLASEYSTGRLHAGRIDTLGLDENNCPVILEYKRAAHENVINQGLFYLNWLMDHQADFKFLVLEKFGKSVSEAIDWRAPRLVCIAADFNRYDDHAVQQIGRNIELIRYRKFGEELLLLEQASVYANQERRGTSAKVAQPYKHDAVVITTPAKTVGPDKSYADLLPTLSITLTELLATIEDYIFSLGDDVQRKELRLYVAFKRLKNFSTIVLQKNRLLLYLHLNPKQSGPLPPNARDVSDIGHWGTGDLEIAIADQTDLDAVKPLITMAYEGR